MVGNGTVWILQCTRNLGIKLEPGRLEKKPTTESEKLVSDSSE